jgi:hypothetical protein
MFFEWYQIAYHFDWYQIAYHSKNHRRRSLAARQPATRPGSPPRGPAAGHDRPDPTDLPTPPGGRR